LAVFVADNIDYPDVPVDFADPAQTDTYGRNLSRYLAREFLSSEHED
jgi:hypothetical protein